MFDSIDPRVFISVGESIFKTIDFKLSKENGHTEIRSGASAILDELRSSFARICKALPDLEEAVRRQAPAQLARHIRYCTFIPQLGFFIAVTFNHDTREGIFNGGDENWQIGFIHEDIAYYKNDRMADLDSHYGHLSSEISGELMLFPNQDRRHTVD